MKINPTKNPTIEKYLDKIDPDNFIIDLERFEYDLGLLFEGKNYDKLLFEIQNYFHNLHDYNVNQKYDKTLKYSLHLRAVSMQLVKFKRLLCRNYLPTNENYNNEFMIFFTEYRFFFLLLVAASAHDSIEDARLTFNDVVNKLIEFGFTHYLAVFVANIVYCVTDEKGKTRATRKNEKFFTELVANIYAVVLKLSDFNANLLYTFMFSADKVFAKNKEFGHFIEQLSTEDYKLLLPIIHYIDKQLNVANE